jgi:NAD(P)H-flavin reductase/hemoglobin-like flavoprotein
MHRPDAGRLHHVAIALDGGIPDYSPDGLPDQPGQLGRVRFDSRFSTRLSRPMPTLTPPYVSHAPQFNDNAIPEQMAHTESGAQLKPRADVTVPAPDFDATVIHESLDRLMEAGTDAARYFYDRILAECPSIQSLFPMEMSAQGERFFAEVIGIAGHLADETAVAELLAELGREQRKFGITEAHYGPFTTALLETAMKFAGAEWRPEVETAWRETATYMSATMRAAAAGDAEVAPRWWNAEVTAHELRAPGVAVLRLAPTEPLPFLAGQYLWVQVPKWPREWRTFSAATAPRPSGIIEIHVRAIPGGLVSNALVYHSTVGDGVLLGRAGGSMTLADSDRDLLCVAGGTGLAPIKAVIEQAITESAERPRRITLFVGARQYFDLYDLEDLQLLESAYPALRVIPVLSDEHPAASSASRLGSGELAGMLPDVLLAHDASMFANHEAYICGPAAMVSKTAAVLAASIPPAQIHHDPL